MHIKGSHLAVHSSINLPRVHHILLVILHTLDLLSDADINLRLALVGAGSPGWLILIHGHFLDVLEGAVQAADVGVQGRAQGTGLDQQIAELPDLCVHLSLVFPAGRDVVHDAQQQSESLGEPTDRQEGWPWLQGRLHQRDAGVDEAALVEGQHWPELPGIGGHRIHTGVVDPGAGVPLLHKHVVIHQPQLEEQGLEEGTVRGDGDVRGAIEGLGAQLDRGEAPAGRNRSSSEPPKISSQRSRTTQALLWLQKHRKNLWITDIGPLFIIQTTPQNPLGLKITSCRCQPAAT